MKIVESALFRSCAARFGQIAFVSVKFLKIVKLAQNSLQNGKRVRFPLKVPFYYNFHKKNSTKRSFQVMRRTFWPNRIFERQSSQNRHTGLKFVPKRKKKRFS